MPTAVTEAQLLEAMESYRAWVADGLTTQTLCLRTISGVART